MSTEEASSSSGMVPASTTAASSMTSIPMPQVMSNFAQGLPLSHGGGGAPSVTNNHFHIGQPSAPVAPAPASAPAPKGDSVEDDDDVEEETEAEPTKKKGGMDPKVKEYLKQKRLEKLSSGKKKKTKTVAASATTAASPPAGEEEDAVEDKSQGKSHQDVKPKKKRPVDPARIMHDLLNGKEVSPEKVQLAYKQLRREQAEASTTKKTNEQLSEKLIRTQAAKFNDFQRAMEQNLGQKTSPELKEKYNRLLQNPQTQSLAEDFGDVMNSLVAASKRASKGIKLKQQQQQQKKQPKKPESEPPKKKAKATKDGKATIKASSGKRLKDADDDDDEEEETDPDDDDYHAPSSPSSDEDEESDADIDTTGQSADALLGSALGMDTTTDAADADVEEEEEEQNSSSSSSKKQKPIKSKKTEAVTGKKRKQKDLDKLKAQQEKALRETGNPNKAKSAPPAPGGGGHHPDTVRASRNMLAQEAFQGFRTGKLAASGGMRDADPQMMAYHHPDNTSCYEEAKRIMRAANDFNSHLGPSNIATPWLPPKTVAASKLGASDPRIRAAQQAREQSACMGWMPAYLAKGHSALMD